MKRIPELESSLPGESPPITVPGDWQTVNGLICRERLLMPSAHLRHRLTASLEALPRQMSREFPGTSGHWGLLGALLLPTALLYGLLYGLLVWVWSHPLVLASQYGGWIPGLGTKVVLVLASIHSSRRPALLEGLQNQVSLFALEAEWQAALLTFGVSLLVAELLAILLLHRLKTSNV